MRISISIPGPGAAAYLPVELIPKIGTDKAEGAEVRVVFAPSGPAALEEMLTNNVDFSVTGMPSAMSIRLTDKRLVALAAINDLPLYALVVREGLRGTVNEISDLRGKAIGLHSNSLATKSTSQQVLELMLRRGGVSPGAYRIVPIGRRWETESLMLRNGEVDALVADEPYVGRMSQEKIAFPLVHLGNPDTARIYSGSGFLRGVLVGRADRVEKNPAKAEKMVRIIKQTLHWIATHSAEEFADKLGVTDRGERQRLIETLRNFPRQFSRDGSFSQRQLRETEIFFIDSQAGNPAAAAFRVDSMIIDRWAGRRE